ncbi:MAG TPA: anti-sigma factor [Candidatus Cybelea sp.]|nr:anti-sigma factor [Candidatus Cybelea sp.]
MSRAPERFDENDVHAFVDGQMEPERRAAFEKRLAADPALAHLVAAYQRQNAALHAVFDPVLGEPVPAALRRRPPGRWRVFAARAAAAIVLVAIGAGGGWLAGRTSMPVTSPATASLEFAERAAAAHAVFAPEVRHPVEVAAPQEDHLVAWLSKRLGANVKAPALGEAGFTLVGGRLLPDESSPAAQFMYEDRQGRRVTLYMRTNPSGRHETAFRWVTAQGVTVCYWIDGTFGYAIAGDNVSREEIEHIATVVYRQLEQ